jgi:hypothetical protein
MLRSIEHVGMAGWEREKAGCEHAGKGMGEGDRDACTVEA